MNEQDEAKTFHAAQAFTNVVFNYSMSAHGSTRNKTGREAADSFYTALIDAIESARKVGRDDTLASESPFSLLEAELLTLHAALFAFNQFSPIPLNQMIELSNGAFQCVNKVIADREAQGIHGKIDPEFVLCKGDNGEVCMGVRLRDKAESD